MHVNSIGATTFTMLLSYSSALAASSPMMSVPRLMPAKQWPDVKDKRKNLSCDDYLERVRALKAQRSKIEAG